MYVLMESNSNACSQEQAQSLQRAEQAMRRQQSQAESLASAEAASLQAARKRLAHHEAALQRKEVCICVHLQLASGTPVLPFDDTDKKSLSRAVRCVPGITHQFITVIPLHCACLCNCSWNCDLRLQEGLSKLANDLQRAKHDLTVEAKVLKGMQTLKQPGRYT